MGFFLQVISLTIVALLPMLNPFATAPLFISLSAGFDARKRKQQALLACIYAFFILVVFLLLGSVIIDFFKISIAGIRVAGGLIITRIGFGMLFPPQVAEENTATPPEERKQEKDIALTPIAMPSLAGPGCIAVVLSAAQHIRSVRPQDWQIIYVAVILGMVATLAICFLVLRAASSMVTMLGKNGIDAVTRIFGFLLVCISMQFLLTGINDFFHIASRVG